MNARSMTRTATMVAMALTMALNAMPAAAAPRTASVARRPVDCRTLESYAMSAWLAPAAVVLTSPEAWAAWNAEMVESGNAVAEEALPAGVDWAREVVLVMALGEQNAPYAMELTEATRSLTSTRMSLHVEAGRGGTSPALVVALPRHAAHNLSLAADYTVAGLPSSPEMYEAAGLAAANASGDAAPVTTASWGAMKAEYR